MRKDMFILIVIWSLTAQRFPRYDFIKKKKKKKKVYNFTIAWDKQKHGIKIIIIIMSYDFQ